MPNQGIFRNVNILVEFNESNTSEAIDIYTPGYINPYDIVLGVKYSGFITSLRATIDIDSVIELIPPKISSLDTDADIEAKRNETIEATPRKCIQFYLSNSNTKPTLVAEVLLFNRVPYYFIGLIKYFTDNVTFDVAPDTIITAQLKDVGYGLLEGTDRVVIVGTAIEEASYIESASLLVE
jgi:hypothetical protein